MSLLLKPMANSQASSITTWQHLTQLITLLEMLSSLGFQNAAAALLSPFSFSVPLHGSGCLTLGKHPPTHFSHPATLISSVYPVAWLCMPHSRSVPGEGPLQLVSSDQTSPLNSRLVYPTASRTLPLGIPPHQTQHLICAPLPPPQSR